MTLRAAVAGLALLAPPLAAQVQGDLSLGTTSAHARSETSGGTTRTAGLTWRGTATVRWREFQLDIRYLEGTLDPSAPGALARGLVDGSAALGVRATDWLTAQVGAHARARATSGGVERWLWFEVRARTSMRLVGQMVYGELEAWRALALEMNVPLGDGAGHGGEAGLIVRFPGQPIWFRLAYAVDELFVPGAARRETLDGLTVAAGTSLP